MQALRAGLIPLRSLSWHETDPGLKPRLLTPKPVLYVLSWVAVLDFFGGSRGFPLKCHLLWFKVGGTWGTHPVNSLDTSEEAKFYDSTLWDNSLFFPSYWQGFPFVNSIGMVKCFSWKREEIALSYLAIMAAGG